MVDGKKLNTLSLQLMLIFALTVTLVVSYLVFIKYEPKVLKNINEVKGLKTQNEFEFPYPRESTQLGVNQTENSKQTTFKTAQSVDQVKEFYKLVFLEKGWEIESDSNEIDYDIIKFKKDKFTASLVIADDTESKESVVGIEIYKR